MVHPAAFVSAVLAFAATAAACDHCGSSSGHRQLAKRLEAEGIRLVDASAPATETRHLEVRAVKAKAKAAAAAKEKAEASKSKAASISKSKSFASKSKTLASKSKAAASKAKSLASNSKAAAFKSKSLASKSKLLASKASSLASKSASVASCAAASSASASRASASLASQQSLAAASASSVSSLASAASSASVAAASAQASLSSALAAFSSSQAAAASSASWANAAALLAVSSLSAAQASVSADAASVAAASSVEAGLSSSLRAASSSLAQAQASASAAVASATGAAGDVAAASASLSSAQASVSAASSAASVASAAAASSASVLSTRSAALEAASSSFTFYAAQVTSSFGSVQSVLSASQAAIDSSASGLSITLSSISVAESEISVSATQLATQSINQASAASAASVWATASGLATACLLPTYLGNGNCYKRCPATYPVQFTRDDTYGLCCTVGSTECINAAPTAATVCDDSHRITILDSSKMTGTCTPACTTADANGVTYPFLQNGGAFEECTVAADCSFGKATADAASGLCCAQGADTCVDQTDSGAENCLEDYYFTASATSGSVTTGSCTSACSVGTFYSGPAGSRTCLTSCPVAGAFFTKTTGLSSVSSNSQCCADPFAKACSTSANIADSCVTGHVLVADGTCVAAGSCPNGAKDNGGVCCADGALTCNSTKVATSCGLSAAGVQTYLTGTGKCVIKADCSAGASILDGGKGVCCADSGSLTCDSAATGHSITCDSDKQSYLLPTVAGGSLGTCTASCAGALFDSASSQCVASCATSTSFYADANGMERCCSAGAASCTAAGPTACLATKGYFLQPDGQSCLKTCPIDSVKNSAGSFCCAKGTSTCSGVALHGDAAVCTSDYFMLDSTCLAVCPRGTVEDVNSKGRKVCTCTAPNIDSCKYDGSPVCSAGYVPLTPTSDSLSSCTKCADSSAASCDASGVPTSCDAGSSLFAPASSVLSTSCQRSCPYGFEFDLTDTSVSGSCQQCYNVWDFTGDDQVYNHFTTVADCRRSCAGYTGYLTAWHSDYEADMQTHCTCFSGNLTATNSFGPPSNRSFCNKYDSQGAVSGGEYWTYITVRLI